MPLETARPQTRLAPELALPPPFTAIRLREVGDAFAHAVAIAPEKGAGTLVYVGRFDLAEFAVVLEPDEPLLKARRTFYAGMAALADALAAAASPATSRKKSKEASARESERTRSIEKTADQGVATR